jgi:lysophospholipase L1-like esterase
VFKTKRFILAFIVVGELLVSCLFFGYIYKQFFTQRKVLGAQTVAVIKKDNLEFPDAGSLKYYYTLKPDTVQEDSPSWLHSRVVNTINSDGLNDRFNYPVEKQSATFRIVTLGDSFTFGQFVNTPENWPEQLENMINKRISGCDVKKVEVLNLGVGGYDVAYIAEHYKTIGAKYQPDLIIWFESGSGFRRANERMIPLKKSCQEKNTSSSSTSAETVANYYACWNQAENALTQGNAPSEIKAEIKQSLSDFMKVIDQKKLLFVTFDESVYKPEETEQLKDWQRSFPDVKFAPVAPDIYKKKEVLPDFHPNKAGYRDIATEITDYLIKDPLRKCAP